ncbi:MAG: hypothetical protein AAGI28_01030 [Pseudomonadota bacterium]
MSFNLILLLASCAPEPTASDGQGLADEPPATSLAADGGPTEGRYRATDEDGLVLIEELRRDGSYSFSDKDGVVIEEGRYTQKSQAELCFTASAEGAAEKCYQEEFGQDGVWRSTDPETNAVAVIERIDN